MRSRRALGAHVTSRSAWLSDADALVRAGAARRMLTTKRRGMQMKGTDIRDELLGEHAGLRGHLDAARLAAERWSRGDVSRTEVHAKLAELAEALRTHHHREERALSELIRSTDGFDDEEHAREHRELLEALARVSMEQDPREGGHQLESFCEGMLAHMTWEERAYLNSRVLPDQD